MKDICKDTQGSNVHNSSKLEINVYQRWMNKQIVIYVYNGIVLNNYKNKEPLVYKTTWMNFRNIILSNRSQAQRHAYCLISFIRNSTTSKRNYSDRKQINGRLEPEVVGGGFSVKGFGGAIAVMEIVLAIFLDSVTLMLNICPICRCQTHLVLDSLIWVISNRNQRIQSLCPPL